MFVRLICKARRLEKRRHELLKEKHDSYAQSLRQEVKLSRKQKYRHFCTDLRRRFLKCFKFPKHSCPYRLCFSLKHKGTVENFVVKSIAGFLGGFCLTYIFFMFFVLQLNFTLSTATIMCSIFGSILTIGLAFSYKVRCIVFLVLPQFFSKKGRQALLAYAYILAITGPAKNTLNNMSILGESLACGQEQLKAAVKQILEVVKKPFYAIRDAIKKVVVTVKEIVAKIKEILLSIKRIIMSLVKIVKAAFDFIARMMNVCNQDFGTPFQRCQKVFEDAIVDCNAKLGPMFNWLCNITYLVKHVCYLAKALDFLCAIIDFIKSTVTAIVTKVKQFVRHIRTMFYVRIKFSHSYHFESNHSKSMGDITTGIVTEIKQRSSGLIKIFDFMSSAASIFFIFMIVKVIYYRHKFLTNEMFDNKFITKDFRQLDLRRAQLGIETVLPLNHRERKLYISTSSMRLVKKEKSRLSQAAMILLMSTLKLSTHMATDYSLYWIMTKIRYYGRFQSKIDAPNLPGVNIEGEGFLAGLLKGIVKAFQPLGINLEIDTIPCLPDPIPPDYDRYIQIGSLLILCWFLAIFEPYGLRFRHSVMCFYHPTRARERAIWLYNHILRSRSSFLKFARRQLRRKVKSDKSISKVTCTEFIRSCLVQYKICVFFFGAGKQKYCLLCGEVNREGDKKTFIKCQTPNCAGLFCEQCFADLQNLCTVCLDPISYGDLSDISEEKDSSEDEAKKKKKAVTEKKLKKKSKKKKKKKKKKSKYYDTAESGSDYDDDDGGDQIRLLPRSNVDKDDSDYSSAATDKTPDWRTDWSSDYDLDYQKHKDISKKSEDATPRTGHADVEKQDIPNYASMQDFHRDVLQYLDNTSDREEVYDTSSVITDLKDVSLQHLNESPDGHQSWLKHKGIRRRSSASPLSSSLTSPMKHFYTSPESEYEDDLFSVNGKNKFPMRRLSSKVSLEKNESTLGTQSTVSNESTPYTKVDDNDDDSVTTIFESSKSQETSFIQIPEIDKKQFRLEPIREESRELSQQNKYGSKDDVGYISKGEKDLINAATSKEIMPSTGDDYDNETSSTITIEALDFDHSGTSPEVSPLGLTYSPTNTSPELQSSPSAEIINADPEPTAHPDVPKLDLQFLAVDNKNEQPIDEEVEQFCHCREMSSGSREMTSPPSSSSRFACNCRLFKNQVKYSVTNEISPKTTGYTNANTSGTSSVISSLYKLPQTHSVRPEPSFNTSLALPATIVSSVPDRVDHNVQTSPSPRTFSLNTSERSVRKCSLDATSTSYLDRGHIDDEPKERSSPDSKSAASKSEIDYNSHSYDDVIMETSTSESIYVLPRTQQRQRFVVEAADRVYDAPSQKDLYKARIRSYYRHLNVQEMPVSPKTPKKRRRKDPSGNPIKNLWRAFKNKHKSSH